MRQSQAWERRWVVKSDERSHPDLVLISEVAEDFGFTLRALRFYEEKGFITPRRIGNRRFYSHPDYKRLEIIAQGKRLGLALEDIGEIIRVVASGNSARWKEVMLQKCLARVEEIEAEQEQLREQLDEARRISAELRAGDERSC